ncbi:MAG: sortase [bacterium]|nr:sortase [bacterium]
MEIENTPILSHKKPACVANATGRPPTAVFLATAFVIFVLTLSAADSIGFVPNYIDGSTEESAAEPADFLPLASLPQLGGLPSIESITAEIAEPVALPNRIVIPAIKMDLPIQNPSTKDINKLTEVLKAGPARYVDSAQLGEKGNMLVFGHSSQLPVVKNQMYKAFNNISKLKQGDTITVYGGPSTGAATTSGGHAYLYSVVSVREGDANEDVIDLSKNKGTRITLVTCNTLGEKSARWIVEAEFVGVLPSSD